MSIGDEPFMKLANYSEGSSALKAGFVVDSKIYPVHDRDGVAFSSVDQILSTDGALEYVVHNKQDVSQGVAVDSVKFAPPVLYPEKIYLAAVNYLSHSKEQNESPPTEPHLFTKFRNALIGAGDSVLLPKISNKVDWEVELAVIIGRRGKDIPKEHALDFVAGYTIANDISFRDLQLPGSRFGMNFVKGKGLDTALPMGPWLVTKDELVDPYSSEISLSVNGVERQNSKIGEMVFKIDKLVEYTSADVTLLPGDIISTGTPHGVAAFTGVPFLKAGDLMEAKIGGIGVLKNYVKAR
jgi:2-keto-4-pentenoate hydratase/2-oxohepta-3-ene-1,7-dioic acid hydratase in catechol pathway